MTTYAALISAEGKPVPCYRDGDTAQTFHVRFKNDGTDRVEYWTEGENQVFSGHVDRFSPCSM